MIAQNRIAATNGGLNDTSGPAPDEIEALLPWHAIGRLNAADERRVEEALSRDPALARQFLVIQDEVAETIYLNENLGAPSARAKQALFDAIDAEPARAKSPSSLWTNFRLFVVSLTPRTLALSACAAAALVVLQAGVVGALLMKPSGNYQVASYGSAAGQGVRALIRFAPDAKFSDITALLASYDASIVSGPKAGMFRVQFGDKALSKDDAAQLLTKVQNEKIVGFVAVAD